MLKTVQKSQKPNNSKKPQIVDQQNQPFLKTISKRIRNINKKLTEIQDLKKKDDLKPEQVQKVKRKAEYEQQRSKLQGIADFYREVYTENVESYRNIQLQELDALANIIAILRGSTHFKDLEKLAELNTVLSQPSNLPLNESAKKISETLKRYANDFKLKKLIDNFLADSQAEKQSEEKPAQQATHEQVQEAKIEERKQQLEHKPRQIPLLNAQKPLQKQETAKETLKESAKEPVKEPVIQITQKPKEEVPVESKPSQAQSGQQKPVQGNGQRPSRGNKTRGDNRGPRENKGPRPRVEELGQNKQEGFEKKRYINPNRQKPSYKLKSQDEDEERDSDSSLERQRVMRNFKREEIRQLEEEGFQVVGKPKPKAKEGQTQYYDKTHGKKTHHHHG